jgi:hypothetical protein
VLGTASTGAVKEGIRRGEIGRSEVVVRSLADRLCLVVVVTTGRTMNVVGEGEGDSDRWVWVVFIVVAVVVVCCRFFLA